MAKEYKSQVDRINSKLVDLKKELVFLRHHDLLLLKQLIEIDESIQSLRQKSKFPRTTFDLCSPDSGISEESSQPETSAKSCVDTMVTFDDRRRLPLVRQQSVPYYMHIYRSVDSGSIASSFDDVSEFAIDDEFQQPSDNDSLFSLSLSGNYPTIPRNLMKPRSLSYDEPDLENDKFEDDYLEQLLLTNISLWKKSENIVQEESQTHVHVPKIT
ncbi:hypothetical protein FSP39_009574 [Pinctada imbricata]|uniref:Uncharacterized protein n=1 Tax=Pinctada imbricata TaxID=66713 RepID=A0AA88YDN9_PINIB|nr:hypothetical protein FSP39_009574 [Pinctada imbricata]